MEKKSLYIYKLDEQGNKVMFPNSDMPAKLGEYTYSAQRMAGTPTLTATLNYPSCLDDLWSGEEFVEFRGEKYYVDQTPTSSKDNKSVMYKHELQFVSERIVLENVYFMDVVTTGADTYHSNSTSVKFMGDINKFVGRLNASMTKSGIGYSVVMDDDITSDSKLVSLDNVYLAEALQSIYTIYELPYYFVGKVCHIGYTENVISTPFEYRKGLVSIKKTNANYKIVNRVTGVGSSDNIPFYYPNDDETGTIERSQNLMPSIYRESGGAERFYNALNNKYKIPGTNDYYSFKNIYSSKKVKEIKVDFSDIKPTIEGVTNSSGKLFGEIADIAFDANDSDELGTGTGNNVFNGSDEYVHSYFYIKLHIYNGDYGFNLFEQGLEGGTAVINMTTGNCAACEFEIGVTYKDNEPGRAFNPVLVDSAGNLPAGDFEQKVTSQTSQYVESQQNTSTNEVWIAVKKDNTSFGVVMPNATNNYKPSIGDKFVITGIKMPKPFVLAAEKRLEEALIKYMSENNDEKFTFSVNFSRIFLADNTDLWDILNENARIYIKYNNKEYFMYVNSYTCKSDKNCLYDISVELTDKLSANVSALRSTISEIAGDIIGSTLGGTNNNNDWFAKAARRFIRKDTNDRTPFRLEVGDKLTAEKGLQISKNFVSGIIGGSGGSIYLDENGKVVIETDKAVFREELIVPQITFNCIDVISGDKANTFAYGTIKTVDTENRIATLDLLEGQYGTLHVSDICRGIFHNIGGGNTDKDTIGANGFIEYSGFATSYFTPTNILENEAGIMKFEYELQVGTSVHPMPGMNFFAYGNFTDEDRQDITYENRYYTRRITHVNNWVIDPETNIEMQVGKLNGLSIGGMDFSGYSFYGKNVYISGTIERLKPNGTPAKDLSYEGVWESGRKYDYYDSVTHDGSTWACMNKNGSSAEPGTNNDWQKIASKGDKGDPGESAVFADLTNEMDNVALTNDGKVYQDTSISTVVWMSYGSKKMTLTGITCTLPANVTETHDVSTGEITFSVKQGVALDGRNPIPVALTATYNGKTYTGQLTFTLAGVKGGADAVLYRLVPSVSAVIKDANGNLNVTSVSCTRLKSSVSGGTAETGTGELKYSLDGGAEVSIGNNAGVPVSSFQKSIKFIFYVDGKEVDVETIPLVTDGKDGQSVSSLGRWHTGLIVPKLGIVTMGGSTFCAKKETANPPLWTTTTSDGRRITQTQDGGRTYGYILSGESNTEEYDLLVQSGKDGSDGTDYERVFIHTTEENRPSTPATSQTDDYIPSGWHDDPIGVSESLPFEWVSEREKKNGVWGNFSTPALWAKYGFDGKGVKYVDVLYAISTSNATAPTTGWQTDAPAWENGKYIWSKTVTTYSDDSVEETSPVCITGGAGATGKGVKTITEYYYMSTSATTLTGGSWSTTRPTWENGKYIWTKSIITYTDNTTSETPGICVTGEKGESITAMGRWYTGLIVPKQGVVTMGGSSYIAKKETTNPPLWTVTTSSGQRIKQTQDGGKTYGYILSGEMNSAEYDLLASKGEDGKPGVDGKPGADGKPGEKGEQGIQGCITRHSEWAVGVTYRNDEALTSGTRYVDIAMIRNNAAIDGWDVYKCNTTHTSSESNKPGVSSSTWTKLSGVGPIYTSLIIAKNASIDFMQGNQLLIKKDDGTVTAGLSGSIAGSKVRIWAGSATPDNAPFRVLESGKMIGTDVELTGTINAISGTIAGFKISGTSISSTDGAYDGGAGNNSYSNSKFFLHADGSSSAFLGFSATNKWVGIGLNCMPATSNMQVLGRFEDTGTSSYTYNKAGLYISIAGATTYDDSNVHGNSALYIPKGHITGFRRRFRRVSTSTTLTNMDSIVRLVNTAEITVTLPAGAEDGQEIWLCSGNEKKVNVKAASGDTISYGGEGFATNRWHIYIYDAYNRGWVYGYTNNG